MIKITWTDWDDKDHQILCTSFEVEADYIDALTTIKYIGQDGIEHEIELSWFSVTMEVK